MQSSGRFQKNFVWLNPMLWILSQTKVSGQFGRLIWEINSAEFWPSAFRLVNKILRREKRVVDNWPDIEIWQTSYWLITREIKLSLLDNTDQQTKGPKGFSLLLSSPGQGNAGALISIRGMQVPWSASGVCRCPDQCRGYGEIGTSNL